MPSALKVTAATLGTLTATSILLARALGLRWQQTPWAIPAVITYGICAWAGKRAEE